MDYQEWLVGKLKSGILYGGVITTFIDIGLGCTMFSALPNLVTIASPDLRNDYLKPAIPRISFYSGTRCYKLTRTVGFTRALAYHAASVDPVINGLRTFIVSSFASGFHVDDMTDEFIN